MFVVKMAIEFHNSKAFNLTYLFTNEPRAVLYNSWLLEMFFIYILKHLNVFPWIYNWSPFADQYVAAFTFLKEFGSMQHILCSISLDVACILLFLWH